MLVSISKAAIGFWNLYNGSVRKLSKRIRGDWRKLGRAIAQCGDATCPYQGGTCAVNVPDGMCTASCCATVTCPTDVRRSHGPDYCTNLSGQGFCLFDCSSDPLRAEDSFVEPIAVLGGGSRARVFARAVTHVAQHIDCRFVLTTRFFPAGASRCRFHALTRSKNARNTRIRDRAHSCGRSNPRKTRATQSPARHAMKCSSAKGRAVASTKSAPARMSVAAYARRARLALSIVIRATSGSS